MRTQLHVPHGSMTCGYLNGQFGDYRLAIGDDLFPHQSGSGDCLKYRRLGGKIAALYGMGFVPVPGGFTDF